MSRLRCSMSCGNVSCAGPACVWSDWCWKLFWREFVIHVIILVVVVVVLLYFILSFAPRMIQGYTVYPFNDLFCKTIYPITSNFMTSIYPKDYRDSTAKLSFSNSHVAQTRSISLNGWVSVDTNCPDCSYTHTPTSHYYHAVWCW